MDEIWALKIVTRSDTMTICHKDKQYLLDTVSAWKDAEGEDIIEVTGFTCTVDRAPILYAMKQEAIETLGVILI